MSFYDDAIETYYIKTMWYKSQVFKIFLEFIFYAKNQLKKKLKRYQTNRREEFDNKVFKSWYLECEVQ